LDYTAGMRYMLKLDKAGGRLSLCIHRIRGVSGPLAKDDAKNSPSISWL
jgi:hypothetical protein